MSRKRDGRLKSLTFWFDTYNKICKTEISESDSEHLATAGHGWSKSVDQPQTTPVA